MTTTIEAGVTLEHVAAKERYVVVGFEAVVNKPFLAAPSVYVLFKNLKDGWKSLCDIAELDRAIREGEILVLEAVSQ